MAAFKGIADKVGHRTGRDIALQKGTNPKGFQDALPYNYQGGYPTGEGIQDSKATVQPPQVKQDAEPVDDIDPPFVMKE